jgi:hypothetical protein
MDDVVLRPDINKLFGKLPGIHPFGTWNKRSPRQESYSRQTKHGSKRSHLATSWNEMPEYHPSKLILA